jgi:hypothetical protein
VGGGLEFFFFGKKGFPFESFSRSFFVSLHLNHAIDFERRFEADQHELRRERVSC